MQNFMGYNPYFQHLQTQMPQNYVQQTQQSVSFPAIYVSDKAEVNSTPADQSGNPKYFHNRLKNEIYVKQYDSSGAAPIKTYRLVADDLLNENELTGINNLYKEDFKAFHERLDEINTKFENLNNIISNIDIRGKK